jgi:hypothetical protein
VATPAEVAAVVAAIANFIAFNAKEVPKPLVAIATAIEATANVDITTVASFLTTQFTKLRPSGSTFEIGSPPQKS